MRHRTIIACLVAAAGIAVPAAGQRPADPPWAGAPVAVCFAPGTDPIYAARMTALAHQLNTLRYGADYYTFPGSSWSGQGTPRTLTWSFAPDGLSIPGSLGEPTSGNTLFATMDGAFAAQGGRATWVGRVEQVFDRWHALAGVSYTRVRFNNADWDDGAEWNSAGVPGLRGDIRIAMHSIDGLGGILAYNQFPPSGDMVLDADDAGLLTQSTSQHLFLRNCLAHEHGHGLGLMHTCPTSQTKLMEPFISTAYDGPRQDDIRGGQFLFGDPGEPDDGPATARALGVMSGPLSFGPPPAPLSGTNDPSASLASIDALGKSDWFSFSVTGPASVAVTATPLGGAYLLAPQNLNGTCPSGTSFDSQSVGNLAVEVYAPDGVTVLGSTNVSPVGQPEVLSNVPLVLPGTYFIRVFSTTQIVGQSQLYRLSVANPCPTITQQPSGTTLCEGQNHFLAVAATGVPAPSYQWRKDNLPILGAVQSSLDLSPAEPSGAGTYDCIVYNTCGSVISDPAAVVVTAIPTITQGPQSQSVPSGSPAMFSVSTPTTAVSYQWRKNLAAISGGTGTTLSIPSVSASSAGAYDCVLTTICGSTPTAAANLVVLPGVCYANCDGSTAQPILNVNDFQCFLNVFAAGDPSGNCDGSAAPPTLNVNDFQCFLNAFAAGCG